MYQNYQRWSAGFDAKEYEHGEKDAVTRLSAGDMPEIWLEPRFRLPQDAKYYCIGSCFARHVEKALMNAGKTVISAKLTLPDFIGRNIYPPSVLTKFNAFSMSRMIDWASPDSTDAGIDSAGLVELKPGEFWNPHLHNLGTYQIEQARAIHAAICANVRSIAEADCVILTLGLTEYWIDTETGTPLNTTPIDWRHQARTKRFAFRNAGFVETLEQMRGLIAKIRAVARSDCRIVVTVSPVPLQRTFEPRDIILSNTWSKSVLRAVCGELLMEDAGVDYFPSFELVINSPRAIAWHHDGRHVREELVGRVMEKFLAAYIASNTLGA